MSGFSDFLEGAIANHFTGDTQLALEDTYVALFTDVINDAGTGTEVTGGAYARVQVNQNGMTSPYWNTHTAGTFDNNGDVTFPTATANWGTIVSWGIMDASSGGNLLFHGLLGSGPQVVTALNTGDIVHAVAHGLSDDDPIVFEAIEGETAPGGITLGTQYYVLTPATDNFQFEASIGGGAVAVTTDGVATLYYSQQKTVNTNDTFKFATGDLNISLR